MHISQLHNEKKKNYNFKLMLAKHINFYKNTKKITINQIKNRSN